ncbi:MAG: hypothetical protein JXR34_10075 [Bacteroidales bacterium]|nr:hypothetical protein [Bacteroidales bacterium]
MARNFDTKKIKSIYQKPESGSLEREMEDMIAREKAKIRIVNKLVQSYQKHRHKPEN